MGDAERVVGKDAVAVVTAALCNARRAGVFDAVASAMLLAIAAIVRQEIGADALDDMLSLAVSVDLSSREPKQ